MVIHSIRWRFQLWLAFLLIAILVSFGATAYQLHRLNRLHQVDDELERRVAAMSRDLRRRLLPPPPPLSRGDLAEPRSHPRPETLTDTPPPKDRFGPRPIRLSEETLRLFDQSDTNAFYFVIWGRDRSIALSSTNAPEAAPRPVPAKLGPDTVAYTRGSFRESYYINSLGECVVAGRFLGRDLAGFSRFAWWLIGGGAAVLALGLGGGWWIAGRALRPIQTISATAKRISAGNLANRISLRETDGELGQLAEVLNSTLARLEAAFEQQKQFTADASHELRTPLAVLISEAQTTLSQPRSASEYRDAVEACLATAQRMRRLSESLLELARLDAGQELIHRVPLELGQVVNDCVEQLRTLAARRDIQFDCAVAPVPMSGDPERLRQVITNLLTNAMDYNHPGGIIRVQTCLEGPDASLIVADTGPGIAAQDLPHIFKRFYRADPSRTHGRCGLGLAICKAIVEAHGGSITVSSQVGVGSTFIVRLPAQ